jgi:hypothetical protein
MVRGLPIWVGMAAGLLGGLCLNGCRSSDDQNLAILEAEREKTELSQRLALLDYRYTSLQPEGAATLAALRDQFNEFELELRKLNQQRSDLEMEIGSLEHQYSELVSNDRNKRRLDAVGRKFKTFTAGDGRVFHEVEVSRVDDVGIALRHKHGAARVSVWDLSSEQRETFGLDERSAVAAVERERLEARMFHQYLDQQLDEERENADYVALAPASDVPKSSLATVMRQPVTKRTSLLSRPPEAFGRGGSSRDWYGYSGYRSYRPRYVNVYYYNGPRQAPCQSGAAFPRHTIQTLPFTRKTP